MRMTPLEDRIYAIASPVAQDMGLALVHIKTIGEDSGMTLQIMAEDPATGRLGIEDCAKLSRALSAVLDVEDPIAGEYMLEVSSPGWDRPLFVLAHYQRFVGSEVALRLVAPINARRRYKGIIQSVVDNTIELHFEGQVIHIPFTQIDKANLVPSV